MKWLQNTLSSVNALLSKKIVKIAIFSLIAIVLYAIMYSNVKPQQLDVEPLTIADETIRSPITMEDVEMTEKKREEAVNQVQPVYSVKPEYAQNRVDLISSIFDSAIEVVEELNQERQDAQTNTADDAPPYVEPTVAEKVNLLKDKLTDTVLEDLSDNTLRALVNSTTSDLSYAQDVAVTAINNVMSERVAAGQVENAKKRVEDEIRFISLPNDLKNATIELGRYAVIQNEFYDAQATDEARQQASDNVEPVRILQGQIIIEEGKLISQDAYRQLGILGLLDTEAQILPFIGLALFTVLTIGLIYVIFYQTPSDAKSLKKLLIFTVILLISLVLMKALSMFPYRQLDISFVFPAALCTMLMKTLLNDRIAIISSIILAACSTVIFNAETSGAFNFSAGIYILFSGIAGVVFLTNQNQRSKIFQAGAFVSVINIIVILALLFIPNSQFTVLQYVYYSLLGIGSGIGSAILTIGLLPYFEAGFGILSDMKLIELSNPNHPLLKKILTDAPGTYHHSIMVANLADAACEAIGANGLLARISCYYHDIGKTKRPKYFIENQMNMENPHNWLDPGRSKEIIIAHTTDGAEILQKENMPKEIVDIAKQHHGTGLLKYFYHKAKEEGQDVKEEDFRYPGPKPQTKEAAVINIADSVEAAVRSMSNPNMEKIEGLVKNIIKERIQDGQFNECDITLKELNIVEKTLCETLHGIFHNRIEYPELKEER